jgi:hypothetical protein
MAHVHRDGTPLTEDQARRIICTNLAGLLQRGSCTVRIRRLRDERRVTFLAELNSRWEPMPSMDYRGHQADQLIAALLAIGAKRTKDVHIAIHNGGNQDEVTIGFHKDAVAQHRGNLYQYIYGQLFWD